MSGENTLQEKELSSAQTSLSQEKMFQKSLDELAQLEKQIFSWDGIISWESQDTIIDESYQKGIQEAKNIQEKIAFIESLVQQFAPERNIQELFEKYKKLPYISQQWVQDLEKGTKKVQSLFQKYPDFKESIVQYLEGKFNFTQYYIDFYQSEDMWKEVDVEKVLQQVLQTGIEQNLEWLADMEKAILATQKNDSIEDKNHFLLNVFQFAPESISDLAEKMNVISHLDFNKKQKGYKYAQKMLDTKDDLHFYTLLNYDHGKLQELDSIFSTGNHKKFLEYLQNNFSQEEIQKLVGIDRLKVFYLEGKKEQMWVNILPLSEDVLLSLSFIRDKNISQEIEKNIVSLISLKTHDEKIKALKDFITHWLPQILLASKDTLDTLYVFSTLNAFVLESHFSWWNEQVGKLLFDLEAKNTKQIKNYIQTQIQQLRKSGNLELVYKLEKLWDFTSLGQTQIIQGVSLLKNAETHSLKNHKEEVSNKTWISEKKGEIQKSLSRLWLNAKISENGSLIWENGETTFTQKIWNRMFEVKEDGNIFIQWAFWYQFQYENNLNGLEKYLKIADQIEYVDDMGLWHFWENFKEMIQILNLYTPYTGLKYIHVDDMKMNSTNFINQLELTNISKAFHKIWFLTSENFSYSFKNGEMQKTEFTHIMQTHFEGRNFFKWWSFDREIFKKIITEIDWKK